MNKYCKLIKLNEEQFNLIKDINLNEFINYCIEKYFTTRFKKVTNKLCVNDLIEISKKDLTNKKKNYYISIIKTSTYLDDNEKEKLLKYFNIDKNDNDKEEIKETDEIKNDNEDKIDENKEIENISFDDFL